MDNSYTAPNDADLSISELSLAEKPSIQEQQPFSLLARPRPRPTRDLVQTTSETNDNDDQNQDTKPAPEGQEVAPREEEDKDDAPDEVDEATTTAAAKQSVTRAREERLKQDLFVLRKLNAAFAAYNDALEETRSSTDHVSEQLKETNALLNKYMDILARSEATTRLIFDERWRGADDDEATLALHRRRAEEKARREALERAEALRREKEKREKEERERTAREERERAEAEKREKLAMRAGYGGVRGVRGTRASMRGAMAARGAMTGRVSSIPTVSSLRGRPSSLGNTSGNASGTRISRPASSASTRPASAASSARPGIR